MSNTENRKPIQSPEELAGRLGFSISTSRKLVSNGDIQSVKIGKHRYVTVEAVEQFLDELNLRSTPGIFHAHVDLEVL
jgi:excisionase family DNA binding protein